MVKGDRAGARTAQDLERKYDFASILNLKQNFEQQLETVNKINSELYNMLDSLVLNLDGLIDDQSDISLWFFYGVPGTLVEPESGWLAPDTRSDHVGDIYYDRGSGNTYIYQGDYTWLQNYDPRLIQAMALTSSDLAEADTERKVYFTTPTTPYQNGDWWIQTNGDLFICQIERDTGVYVENDFIVSSSYAGTNANEINNILTIISGTVTTIKQSNDSISQLVEATTLLVNGLDYAVNNKEGVVSKNYAELKQTAFDLNITIGSVGGKVQTIEDDGATKVQPYGRDAEGNLIETNFKFDQQGLSIAKNGEEMSSFITNEGLYVYRDKGKPKEAVMLKADSNIVEAENITVRTYLVIGDNSRMEDYEGGTGIFYIGT